MSYEGTAAIPFIFILVMGLLIAFAIYRFTK